MLTLSTMTLIASVIWLAVFVLMQWRVVCRNLPSWRSWSATLPNMESDPERYYSELASGLTDRFQHGWGCYTFASSPLCWLAGRFVPRLAVIQSTNHLFRYASHAVCSQQAQALVDTATRRGGLARVVSLIGHVVAEAFYDQQWHGFDPDYGVCYRVGDEILSAERLASNPVEAACVYRQHRLAQSNEEVLAILRRQSILCHPSGRHLSPRLWIIQQVLYAAHWLVPLVILAWAGLEVFRGAG